LASPPWAGIELGPSLKPRAAARELQRALPKECADLEAAMTKRDPNIVYSGLSGKVTRDGITVEVVIIRLEHETEWSLEVVNAANTSIVWEEPFATDEDAYAEFERTVAEEGMRTFLDSGKVIPFRR
jgi:hypothetical protein